MDENLRCLLAKHALFTGLDEGQVKKIARLLRPESFPEGEVILREASPPDRVYLLLEGRVTVTRGLGEPEETVIAELGAGDFFGEMPLVLGAEVRTANVRAVSPVKALSMGAEDFGRILSDFPRVARNALSRAIAGFHQLGDRFLESRRRELRELEERVRERTGEFAEVDRRIRKELVLAQSIQRNLLPEKRRVFPPVSVAAEYVPCDELGGDITGVFQIDETRIGVYGGDVCGHGVYAAMVMSYVKKLVETSVKRILLNRQYVVKPPGAVLTSINQSFIAEMSQGDPEIYLTLFLGVLDIGSLAFAYSSAGTHVAPLVVSGGCIAELYERSDYPIGHVPGHEYETRQKVFAPGDVFLFASDGVVEAESGGEQYGMERLKAEVLRDISGGELDLARLVASVKGFLGESSPQDDMCLLTMAFTAVGKDG